MLAYWDTQKRELIEVTVCWKSNTERSQIQKSGALSEPDDFTYGSINSQHHIVGIDCLPVGWKLSL